MRTMINFFHNGGVDPNPGLRRPLKDAPLTHDVRQRPKLSLIFYVCRFSMRNVTHSKSVEFFETQFQRQIREQDYALNPSTVIAEKPSRPS
ncbi:MAG: hypothetical protein ACREQA_07245 [Candidatus Binatia bacterium]